MWDCRAYTFPACAILLIIEKRNRQVKFWRQFDQTAQATAENSWHQINIEPCIVHVWKCWNVYFSYDLTFLESHKNDVISTNFELI